MRLTQPVIPVSHPQYTEPGLQSKTPGLTAQVAAGDLSRRPRRGQAYPPSEAN